MHCFNNNKHKLSYVNWSCFQMNIWKIKLELHVNIAMKLMSNTYFQIKNTVIHFTFNLKYGTQILTWDTLFKQNLLTARNCRKKTISLTSQEEKVTGAYSCAENYNRSNIWSGKTKALK